MSQETMEACRVVVAGSCVVARWQLRPTVSTFNATMARVQAAAQQLTRPRAFLAIIPADVPIPAVATVVASRNRLRAMDYLFDAQYAVVEGDRGRAALVSGVILAQTLFVREPVQFFRTVDEALQRIAMRIGSDWRVLQETLRAADALTEPAASEPT